MTNAGAPAGPIRNPAPRARSRKIDFTVKALDFLRITNLLSQFVTDQGSLLLPRRYTGCSRIIGALMNTAIKRARQMLLMK